MTGHYRGGTPFWAGGVSNNEERDLVCRSGRGWLDKLGHHSGTCRAVARLTTRNRLTITGRAIQTVQFARRWFSREEKPAKLDKASFFAKVGACRW
jgi:hypothetical protein